MEQVQSYQMELKRYGLRDGHVVGLKRSALASFCLLIYRFILWFILTVISLPGVILLTPTGLIANNVAAKKAQEAKAGSTVKIAGRDVLATWKVMVVSVLYPLFHIVYLIAAILCVVFLLDELWLRILIPLLVLFCWPLIAYLSIRSFETGVFLFRTFRPLLWSSCPCCIANARSHLQKVRGETQKLLVSVIDTLTTEKLDESRPTELVRQISDGLGLNKNGQLDDNVNVDEVHPKVEPMMIASSLQAEMPVVTSASNLPAEMPVVTS